MTDLTGQTFGQWAVLGPADRAYSWTCRCSCGAEATISKSNLISGRSTRCRDCGHYRKPEGEAGFNRLLRGYKRQAKNRGVTFELTSDEFRVLVLGDCAYCGAAPSQVVNSKRQNRPFVYNGIDRIDNTRPYSLLNCVSCCGLCNHMKVDLSQQEFIDHIARVLVHVTPVSAPAVGERIVVETIPSAITLS